MKRCVAIFGTLLAASLAVAGAALPAGAAGAPATSGTLPRSQLKSIVCHPAIDPQNRSMSVTAVMRPVPGTQKLQLKFDLLAAGKGSSTQTSVKVGNLGKWLTPKNPTLGQVADDVWNFKKSIFQLEPPATYRFRVSFRWMGSAGDVLSTSVRFAKRCWQPELRPDLMVKSITVAPVAGHANQGSYTAVIRNNGASAAGPFAVEFNPNDNQPRDTQTQTIRLKAYSEQTLTFTGPVCDASSPPEVIADSAAQVNNDLNPANDSLYAVCPGTTGG
jgi:hypothetical protein